MLELLRDPLWQFIGALVALAALAASFVIYSLQRQRKLLAYEVVSRNQLLTVGEELEGKLQVLYEGQPTKDICLLVVRLTNPGNVPVATADYERPISFATGDNSRVLSAAVTEREPEGLDVKLRLEPSRVVIEPTLLNAKDSITVKFLVSDYSGTLVADGRVIGVKMIARAGQSTGYNIALFVVALVLLAAGMYLLASYSPKPEIRPPLPFEQKVGLGLVAASYIALVYAMLKSRQFRMVLRRVLRRG